VLDVQPHCCHFADIPAPNKKHYETIKHFALLTTAESIIVEPRSLCMFSISHHYCAMKVSPLSLSALAAAG